MQPEQSERLAEIVASALECDVDERAQFLSDVCGDDISLREEAESLLRFEEKARVFMETPAYALAPPQKVLDEVAEVPVPESRDEPIITPLALPVAAREDRVPSRAPPFAWRPWIAVLVAVLVMLAVIRGLTLARREADVARRQRDLAQQEQQKAERLNRFLQRTFSLSDQSITSVWPVVGKKDVTVNELLARITSEVEKEFADQPEIRAQILGTAGRAYASQGRYELAEKNLRRSLAAQISLHGKENAQVAETLIELGVLSYRQSKLDEASAFLEKAVAFYRKKRQANSPEYSAAKFALALDYFGIVKFHRENPYAAKPLLEEALQISSSAGLKGSDRGVVTLNKADLGGVLAYMGEFDPAITLLQEAVVDYRRPSLKPRWEVGSALTLLGMCAVGKHRLEQAEKYLLEAEEILRQTLGDKNAHLASNLNLQAIAACQKNDLTTAEEKARQSLTMSKELYPKSKVTWTNALSTLAEISIQQDRLREGEDYLREALAIYEEQPTRNYVAIDLMKVRLSQFLLSQKRFTEAENLAFEAHGEARRHVDEQNPARKAVAKNLVQIYENQGKREAARAVK